MTAAEMSPSQWREALAAFEKLQDLEATARRRELDALRDRAPELHARVQTLMRADDAAERQEFLTDSPAAAITVLAPGAEVAAYRLERSLGEGGMGEVWLARRADGLFEAPVALKLPHVHVAHSSAARGRFVREGRILGGLTHPNVARLLDAGVTPSGQLYLALEYVEGERIDRWCDERRLDIEARLRLMQQVCAALSHAHAHLVVHRDVKPSNILVTAAGEVKLLDFGIAKLVENDTSSGQTEFTHLGGRVLTPEYAAPEQVEGGPITVATDVYGLGVLLYALLSGRRPYGPRGATASQIERAVLEAEPAPVSQARALNADDPTTDVVAQSRGTTPRKLADTLAGDLDLIVARALKKNPAERYPTIAALSEDLRRYLDHEPVLVRPDSLAYRTRKYFRRHRVAVSAAAAVALAVLAGVAGTVWQAQEAREQALRANQEAAHAQAETQRALAAVARTRKVKDFMVLAFEQENPFTRGKAGPLTMAQAIDGTLSRIQTELGDDPELQADLLDDFGEILAARGEFERAEKTIGQALEVAIRAHGPQHPAVAESSLNLAALATYRGSDVDAAPHIERAVTILRAQPDADPEQLAAALSTYGTVQSTLEGTDAGAAIFEEALALRRKTPGPNHSGLIAAVNNMAHARVYQGRFEEAETLYDEVLALIEQHAGPESAQLHAVLLGLAQIANERRQLERERALLERSLRIVRATYPGDHAWTARSLSKLGVAETKAGRVAEGEAMLREAIAMQERIGSDDAIPAIRTLVASLSARGQVEEAIAFAQRGLAICARWSADPESQCRSLRATSEALSAGGALRSARP